MEPIDWSSEITRGTLSHATLAALSARPRYGYELLGRMRERGLSRIQGGTLYPLLRRLEEHGLVTHRWDTEGAGPARKVFTLTDLGRSELAAAEQALDRTVAVIRSLRDEED